MIKSASVIVVGAMAALMAAGVDSESVGVEETLQQWAAAWPAGEPGALLVFYEPSPQIVTIASSGQRYDGAEGVRKMYEEAFAELEWRSVELKLVNVTEEGDVAWADCDFNADAVVKQDRVFVRFRSQGTFVLRRKEGKWSIVQEHFSPKFDTPRVEPIE